MALQAVIYFDFVICDSLVFSYTSQFRLTESLLSLTDPGLFALLLETWFPAEGEPPKAFLVDTSEEALLIPDWLKLRMIRSGVDRLVDAALVDLDVPQLVLFIQSFGIPVSSMRFVSSIRFICCRDGRIKFLSTFILD